jgi:hypothetical protein
MARLGASVSVALTGELRRAGVPFGLREFSIDSRCQRESGRRLCGDERIYCAASLFPFVALNSFKAKLTALIGIVSQKAEEMGVLCLML